MSIAASSESEGEDGYDLVRQFDEVPIYNEEAMNIDQEIALERSLMQPEPEPPHQQQKQDSNVS